MSQHDEKLGAALFAGRAAALSKPPQMDDGSVDIGSAGQVSCWLACGNRWHLHQEPAAGTTRSLHDTR